jgi:hypothetical protein
MVLVTGRCVSSAGLGCSHWQELVYAWRHGWLAVVLGLVVAGAVAAAGTRYPQLLPLGAGFGLAIIIGFAVYYISL